MLECVLDCLRGAQLAIRIVGRVHLGARVHDQPVQRAGGEFVQALLAEGNGAHVAHIRFMQHPLAHVGHSLTGEICEPCDKLVQFIHAKSLLPRVCRHPPRRRRSVYRRASAGSVCPARQDRPSQRLRARPYHRPQGDRNHTCRHSLEP